MFLSDINRVEGWNGPGVRKNFLPFLKNLLEYSWFIMMCYFQVIYIHIVAQLCLTLWPHGLQHARLPCPLPSPGVRANSCWMVMPSSHLILCHALLLLPSVFPRIRVFSNESAFHIRWPKYWSFSFSISPSNEYSGLISFRMDWLDLLAVQGTLKSLLQHHSSKASILLHSAFFMVQLSHLHLTIGKTISLTRQAYVIKVVSLLFNMLSRWL